MGTRLYVGNLSYDAMENDLRDLFEKAGSVTGCNIMIDRPTGRSKGFAFVEMDSKEDADDSKKAATVGLANMVEDQEIWTCAPGSAPETPFKDELYDRRADPYQLNNLIDSKPDVADEMVKRLMEYMLELRTAG